MKTLSIFAVLLSLFVVATASAHWTGVVPAHNVDATVQAPDSSAVPVVAVSHTKSVLLHTQSCVCGTCCPSHIKVNRPAPGYENIFNRRAARTTMGYKVLFDF